MYPLIFHNFRLKRCLAMWSVVPNSITIFCGAFSTLCGGCAAAGGPPVVGWDGLAGWSSCLVLGPSLGCACYVSEVFVSLSLTRSYRVS